MILLIIIKQTMSHKMWRIYLTHCLHEILIYYILPLWSEITRKLLNWNEQKYFCSVTRMFFFSVKLNFSDQNWNFYQFHLMAKRPASVHTFLRSAPLNLNTHTLRNKGQFINQVLLVLQWWCKKTRSLPIRKFHHSLKVNLAVLRKPISKYIQHLRRYLGWYMYR